MSKLPHKAYLLTVLAEQGMTWDKPVIDAAMQEYGLSGKYWRNHFSLALDELASAGLIERCSHRIDESTGQLTFECNVTPFGRQRMFETGLIRK